jgi:hypothetical protein
VRPPHEEVTEVLDRLLSAGTVSRLDVLADELERAHRAGHRAGLEQAVRELKGLEG